MKIDKIKAVINRTEIRPLSIVRFVLADRTKIRF